MPKNKKAQIIEMLISWFRVFMAAVVAQMIAGITEPSMLLNAGLAAVLPVLLRWLDPEDKAYGKGAVS